MNLQEIKDAVDAGKTVHWSNPGYKVIKDDLGRYLIESEFSGSKSWIGLTWTDGVTLNGKEEEFFCPVPQLETLRIEGVDLSRLEKQRVLLVMAIETLSSDYLSGRIIMHGPISDDVLDALAGISSMLDHWSDERARNCGGA